MLVANDAKGGLVKVEMTPDAWLDNCELYNAEILGRVRVHGNDNVFHGNTVVTDTLDNFGYYYHINIPGNILNQGVIRDASYSLYLHISGDITNNGVWENDYTYLEGTGDQHVTCLAGNRFSGYQFESNNTANVYFDVMNAFDNVRIDFHNNALHLGDTDTLIVHNAYLYRCNVVGDTTSVLVGEGVYGTDAPYFQEDVFNDLTLEGTFAFKNDCATYGLITNNGIMTNNGYYYVLSVYGDIINNNMITNQGYTFTVDMYGDFINNGICNNSYIVMKGTSEQHIRLKNNHYISAQLKLISNINTSPFQWYWNGSPVTNPPNPQPPIFSGINSPTLIFLSPVDDLRTGTYYCSTGGGTSRNIIIDNNLSDRLDIHAILEGSFDGNNVSTTLNSKGLIPLSQPFAGSPWNYNGTEIVSSVPSDVVDWVLIELRDAPTASQADTTTVVERVVGFLRNDEMLTGLDGVSPLTFNSTITDNLFVVVYHRNHSPVMSANPVPIVNGYYYYDFTAAGQAYNNAEKNINGTYVMIGGDANADGSINQSDLQIWRSQTGAHGYFSADFDMNGEVDNKDKNEIFIGN